MLFEDQEILDPDTVLLPIHITLLDQGQDLDLVQSQLEILLVRLDDFDGHKVFGFVIEGLDHLPETPCPQSLDELVPEPEMVMLLPDVVPLAVISFGVLALTVPYVIDLFLSDYLSLLLLIQI